MRFKVAILSVMFVCLGTRQTIAAAALPDAHLTPGVVRSKDVAEVCQPGYARLGRRTSRRIKQSVFRAYKVTDRKAYVIDHLIPLELGGADDLLNLWPQSKLGRPWNSIAKDRLEGYLRRHVCNGDIPLDKAQLEIRTDWIAAYHRYLGR